MFNFTLDPTFKTKFRLQLPGGKSVPVTVEFKYFNRDQVRDYFDNLSGKNDPESLAEIIVGWDGLGEAYSLDSITELCKRLPSAATQFFDAWRGELFEARRKN
ncbi:MAG: phage tail assembly chaperone [Betaproteobacteria bacterium]